MNIDDGDIFIGEYANGAIGSIQTSFVTIGNYPGIEARIYGEKGAIICRLVEEFGVAETIKVATPDEVEFKERRDPAALLPGRRAPARVVAQPVLRQPDQGFHRRDHRGRRAQPGQLRRRRLGAGGDQRRRAIVPRAPLGRSAAGAMRTMTDAEPRPISHPHDRRSDNARAFTPGWTTSSPRTTGIARSTPPLSACTRTTSACPIFRSMAWAMRWPTPRRCWRGCATCQTNR